MPCLIKLISLDIWAQVIVTELILYKTIIVSYQLLFQCVPLSDYFPIKERNPNTIFIFLCSVQHDRLYVFVVLFIFLFFIYFQYNFYLYNHYLNTIQLYLFFTLLSFLQSFEAAYNNTYNAM